MVKHTLNLVNQYEKEIDKLLGTSVGNEHEQYIETWKQQRSKDVAVASQINLNEARDDNYLLGTITKDTQFDLDNVIDERDDNDPLGTIIDTRNSVGTDSLTLETFETNDENAPIDSMYEVEDFSLTHEDIESNGQMMREQNTFRSSDINPTVESIDEVSNTSEVIKDSDGNLQEINLIQWADMEDKKSNRDEDSANGIGSNVESEPLQSSMFENDTSDHFENNDENSHFVLMVDGVTSVDLASEPRRESKKNCEMEKDSKSASQIVGGQELAENENSEPSGTAVMTLSEIDYMKAIQLAEEASKSGKDCFKTTDCGKDDFEKVALTGTSDSGRRGVWNASKSRNLGWRRNSRRIFIRTMKDAKMAAQMLRFR